MNDMSFNATPSAASAADIHAIARDMRRLVVDMAYRTRTAHLGPALGIVEMLAVLYFRVLEISPAAANAPQRDRFILSKGHAAAALYAALAHRGFITRESALEQYCVDGGRFHGHPCMHAGPGIEFSTGSLGHGLSVAAGIALGLRRQGNPARVYTLMGDGECQEGSVWEAAMFAHTHGISGLTVLVDQNGFQGFGATGEVHRVDLARLWAACGWDVQVCDGHDPAALEQALRAAQATENPSVILAQTVAGKGIPSLEKTLLSHYAVLDEPGYAEAIRALGYEK
ncbi:MAG: hypothetical protein RL141_649 [Candidatus Parcubacteria bacterium]|jgi:transketolase